MYESRITEHSRASIKLSYETATEIVETLGPCTRDIRTCEIMRTAIFLQNTDPDNTQAQAIRQELAKVACQMCVANFLLDLKE